MRVASLKGYTRLMKTKTESIYIDHCLVDGFKLLFKNMPMVVILTIVMFSLNYLRDDMLNLIAWRAIWELFGPFVLTHNLPSRYYMLTDECSLNVRYHLIGVSTFIVISSIIAVGIALLTAKALQFLNSEETSLKVAWQMVKPNVLKLILLNLVLQVLMRMPWIFFNFLAIVHFATAFDFSNVLRFFRLVPALSTAGQATAQHQDIAHSLLVPIITWILACIIIAVGQFLIAHIIGGYGSHFIKDSILFAKRTFWKLVVLAICIEFLKLMPEILNGIAFFRQIFFSFHWRTFYNIELFVTQFLILLAVTTFTVLFFHASKKEQQMMNYYEEETSDEMFTN